MRVLLVEDQKLFGEALQQMLESEEIEVVGVCSSAEEALTSVDATTPDMVLVDVGLPDMSGIELGKKIVARHPATKVVVLTARSDPQTEREAFDSGFHGFVSKEARMTQLISSLVAVNEGQVVMPQRHHREVPKRFGDQRSDLLASQLTRREIEVLLLLMEGASSKQIAKHLSLRVNTARTHVQNVLTKLQVHSRLEATAYAARVGITRSDIEKASH